MQDVGAACDDLDSTTYNDVCDATGECHGTPMACGNLASTFGYCLTSALIYSSKPCSAGTCTVDNCMLFL